MGVIALIPALISKKGNTAIRAASFIEALALIPVTALAIIHLEAKVGFALEQALTFKWCYALLIAFGGTLLILIIQSFIFKKGSGVVKFILLLLSAIGVLVMFPLGLLIPKLSTAFGGKLAVGLYTDAGGEGLASILAAFLSNPFKSTAFTDGDVKSKVMIIAMLVLSFLVFINFVLDMIGLAKKTNKAMLIANLVRYALEVICVIVVIVMAFVIEGYSAKLLAYVLAVVAVLALVINVIRLVAYIKKKKKAAKKAKQQQQAQSSVIAYTSPVTTEVTEEKKVDKKAEKKAAKQAAKDAKEAEKAAARDAKEAEAAAKKAEKEEAEKAAAFAPLADRKEKEETVYTVEKMYDGPVDDFIKKLSNAEKIEFAQVFLERNKVSLNNVPDYVVGGNNSKFFSQVFIYYGRVRDYVSDGLMNRLYEEARMMD
ncbi:MAG: hypothetical protein HDP34_00675 [Clostridia bacterium]|nr:hypothetical protein [Clostridia bacterium]